MDWNFVFVYLINHYSSNMNILLRVGYYNRWKNISYDYKYTFYLYQYRINMRNNITAKDERGMNMKIG